LGSAGTSTIQRHLRTALIGVVVLFGIVHCLRFRDFTVDDSAISYAYSQNFAHGDGVVATAHGERVEGYSNFLWVMLVGVFVAVFGHVMIVGKVLGLLLGIVLLIGVAELSAALRQRPSALDAIPAALCATFTPIPYWSMSGLENPLFISLTVWACVRLLREAQDPTLRPWSALFVAGIVLTRPDGLVVLAAAFVARLFVGHTARRLPLWVLLAGVPIVAHVAWRYSYYAYPWPNTYYVKLAFPVPLRELFDLNSNGWKYVIAFGKRYQLVPLLLFSVFSIVTRKAHLRLIVFGLLGAILFFPLYARGDWMSEGRFIVGAVPFLFVLAVDGIENLGALVRRIPGGATITTATITLLFLLLAWSVVPNSLKISNARVHSYPVTVEMVAVRALRYRQLATLLGIEHPSTADGDAGGNLMHAGMPLVDIGWLNDGTLSHWGRFPGFVREYLFSERKPTFFLLVGFWLNAHHQDNPEFQNYVAIPKDGAGHFIARSAFTADDVDTRKALRPLSDGIDVLALDVGTTTVSGLLLARRDEPATQLLVRGPGLELDVAPGNGLYPPSLWRKGEVVKVSFDRPTGASLNLCADALCIPLEEGHRGATRVPVPQPTQADARILAERGELAAALEATAARSESTQQLGKDLYRRALAELDAGQTGSAFEDFQRALRGAPGLAFARRHIEDMRIAPRFGYHPILAVHLAEEVRTFHLAATADGLSTLTQLSRAARDPLPAIRAHLATGIAPKNPLALADCYFDVGLPQQAAALLAASIPSDEIELAAFDRIALGAGRRDLFDRWNHPPRQPQPVADGLGLTSVSGRLTASGDTLLDLVLVAKGVAVNSIVVDGKTYPLRRNPASWLDGERVSETIELGSRPASATVAIGSARVLLESHPFVADFESGRLDGWTATGMAFEDQPRDQLFHETFGTQGNRFVSSKDSFEGRLTSPVLSPQVSEACFLLAGYASNRVVLESDGQAPVMVNAGNEIAGPRCVKKTRSDGDWRLAVEDRTPSGHIVFDDVTCFGADGAPVACAGSVSARLVQ